MRPFSPQNATFTDGSPGVGSPGWYVNPRDVVSWMWSFDPYTFYVPQTTIAAKREPFEIASLLRVQLLFRQMASFCTGISCPSKDASSGRFMGKSRPIGADLLIQAPTLSVGPPSTTSLTPVAPLEQYLKWRAKWRASAEHRQTVPLSAAGRRPR